MRLIDADEFMNEVLRMQKLNSAVPLTKEKLLDDNINNYDCGQRETFGLIIEHLEKQPTAFDVRGVIAELEEKRDFCYSEMKELANDEDYFSGHIFDEYHNQGFAYNIAIDIIKSALNQ